MDEFDVHIKPKRNLLEIDLKAVWRYRDLLRMFVFRDFVTYYKQTILGPLWFFIQPMFTAAINLFVFGSLAGLGPEGVPGFLFYLSGPILWQYFQDTFIKTSATFVENQAIFGKVYFPRLIMPLTTLISGLLKFGVQLSLLLIAIAIYFVKSGEFSMQWEIVFFPLILMIIMMTAMGFGLIVSALTTKYRDLKFLIEFGIPLLKYVTPGIATSMYLFKENLPDALIPFAIYNPIGYLIDMFNYMFIGVGHFSWASMGITAGFAAFVLFVGVLIFNQTEKNFMDTV
ncbi:MAG: ABC transporter permease [Crocinitomicaceae bacterium]|nr:ABC transporter permease [Crocinitomicaceae bacterium]